MRDRGDIAGKLLPLWPGAKPCVRCGYCCRRSPCGFGWTKGPLNPGCMYLRGDRPGEYACGIIDSIIGRPDWELNPAFGAGCSSPLNSERRRLVEAEGRPRA